MSMHIAKSIQFHCLQFSDMQTARDGVGSFSDRIVKMEVAGSRFIVGGGGRE